MRVPHYLTRNTSGGLTFRIVVPRALRARLGRTAYTRTLCGPLADAATHAQTLRARYACAFALLGVGSVGTDDDALKAGLAFLYGRDGDRTQYKIKQGPGGVEIEAADADDHRRAMEALSGLERMKKAEAETAAMFASPAYQQARAFINAPTPAPPGPVLEDALTMYWATEGKALAADTLDARQRAAAAFAAHVGKRARVGEVSKAQAVAWADHLLTVGGVAKPTARNYTSNLRVIWDWLIGRGEAHEPNPFTGVVKFKASEKRQRRRAGHGWEPFDGDQLRAIFSADNLRRARTEHVRWGVLIGLYTGARVGEVAQIHLRDITDEESGQPCLLIRAEAEGQRVKAAASERRLPIHPDLIRLGLLERVAALRAAGETRLFDVRLDSAAGVGATISKGFTNYLGLLGVAARKDAGTVGFHSFRKTMTHALQSAGGVIEERRRAYLGHEPGEDDSHATAYMRVWTPSELAAVFGGIRWSEWLDFDGLKPLLSTKTTKR